MSSRKHSWPFTSAPKGTNKSQHSPASTAAGIMVASDASDTSPVDNTQEGNQAALSTNHALGPIVSSLATIIPLSKVASFTDFFTILKAIADGAGCLKMVEEACYRYITAAAHADDWDEMPNKDEQYIRGIIQSLKESNALKDGEYMGNTAQRLAQKHKANISVNNLNLIQEGYNCAFKCRKGPKVSYVTGKAISDETKLSKEINNITLDRVNSLILKQQRDLKKWGIRLFRFKNFTPHSVRFLSHLDGYKNKASTLLQEKKPLPIPAKKLRPRIKQK